MATLIGRNSNIKKADLSNYLQSVKYLKEKNGKHIYQDLYTDEFYMVWPESVVNDRWNIEKYKGVCQC